MVNPFLGMEIVVHAPKIVERSLSERWLTRPWKPWTKTRTIGPSIGPHDCYRIGNVFHMGHSFYDKLCEKIEDVKGKDVYVHFS